ncbi:MAG: hypothetical protein ABW133_09925 [Polyangiaceae bacterium]
MKAPSLLPDELVWTSEGHLSDVAMTAIADGEEAILPRDAFGHLGLCAACALGVESAAALSADVNLALAARATADATEKVEKHLAFPVWAATLAVVVGALATFPNLHVLRAWIARTWWAFREGTPLVTRHVASVLPHAWNWLPMMSLAAAMLLLIAGLSVARLAPREIER